MSDFSLPSKKDVSRSFTRKQTSAHNSSTLSGFKKPEFYLYTKLNQNETKTLRKAQNNHEERKVLAQIFGLKSILTVAPGETPSKVELLKLDFYYINYQFCKDQYFSNEKTSTMLAIFDHVFQRMLERILKPEQGLRILKGLLSDHSIQRPPFSIFIFEQSEVDTILKFAKSTFLRHFSLYEFAFKPRVELVLRTDPVIVTKFNAPIVSLDDAEMEEVEENEASRMRAFLGAKNDEAAADIITELVANSRTGDFQNPNNDSLDKSGLGDEESPEKDAEEGEHEIDWKKVGKVYEPNAFVEDVVSREMDRLNKAFDIKLAEQQEDLVTKNQSAQSKKK